MLLVNDNPFTHSFSPPATRCLRVAGFFMPDPSNPIWSSCGHDRLTRNARGWLSPTDDYWRLWLERPELALVEESCPAEQALHAALVQTPTRVVSPGELEAFEDEDARANHRLFLGFRDAVIADFAHHCAELIKPCGNRLTMSEQFFRVSDLRLTPNRQRIVERGESLRQYFARLRLMCFERCLPLFELF